MSSTPAPPPMENPSILQKPTLGQAVQLGELYDARTASFLGTQMYDQKRINDAIAMTHNRFTDLSLSMTNTLQDKASVIDLSAELSVSVLSGLIKVSGSAAYFHDSKSNTQERTWVLSYKARLREERLCFSEKELGLDVLPLVWDNYIKPQAATHFVSAITYGGNVFARMTARESKLEEEQKIEGKLEASFEGLKSALDVSGKVEIKVNDTFKDLNDKFDVQVYGDVALSSVPLNPEDVMETFSKAAEALVAPEGADHGGVPISVTLQPIPPSLFDEKPLLARIEESILNGLLDEYANLEDVNSRFSVLSEFAKAHQNIVPDFARTVELALVKFRKEYRKCLETLAQAVRNLLKGETPSTDPPEADPPEDEAQKLYRLHTLADDPTKDPDDIGRCLCDLEPFFFKFRQFVNGIGHIGYRLRSVDEVSLAALTVADSKIPLVLVPHISAKDKSLTRMLIRLSFLLRTEVPRYFSPPGKKFDPHSCYLLYVVEETLEDWLPDDCKDIKEPTIYSGEVTAGILTWTKVPRPTTQPIVDLANNTFSLHCYPSDRINVRFPLIDFAPAQSYSLMFPAWIYSLPSDTRNSVIMAFGLSPDYLFASFKVGRLGEIDVVLSSSFATTDHQLKGPPHTVAPKSGNYTNWFTLVRDVEASKISLYVNAKLIDSCSVEKENFPPGKQALTIWCDNQYSTMLPNSAVSRVMIFPSALNQEEISTVINQNKLLGDATPIGFELDGSATQSRLPALETATGLNPKGEEGTNPNVATGERNLYHD